MTTRINCTHPDHPAEPHGHYGYGGVHWCSDFNSPLLSEDNMGHVEHGRIVMYSRRPARDARMIDRNALLRVLRDTDLDEGDQADAVLAYLRSVITPEALTTPGIGLIDWYNDYQTGRDLHRRIFGEDK